MMTDILLGATLATILITATVLYAALNDIQIALERIERRQDDIYVDPDVYDSYDDMYVDEPLDETA